MKDKHLSIRIPYELYQKYVKETIKRTNQENRLVKVSEIIREILEKGVKGE
jgi:predicted DNA-binding protein